MKGKGKFWQCSFHSLRKLVQFFLKDLVYLYERQKEILAMFFSQFKEVSAIFSENRDQGIICVFLH